MSAPRLQRILLPCEGSCGAAEGVECRFDCDAVSRRFREVEISEEHDRAFFEQMATCRAAYRRLGDVIHETLAPFGIATALDLGAGLGHVPARLGELGWTVAASDLYAPEDLREPPAEMWLHRVDLKLPPLFDATRFFDLVICTETAEHIPGAFADAVVASVANRAARHVVWSAAQPGQEWPGHVNLQPPPYWLSRFARLGLEPLLEESAALRSEMRARRAQHEYAADNFFILRRRP